jgi:hypothetical protein
MFRGITYLSLKITLYESLADGEDELGDEGGALGDASL